jgi:hypothetical protein
LLAASRSPGYANVPQEVGLPVPPDLARVRKDRFDQLRGDLVVSAERHLVLEHERNRQIDIEPGTP